MNFTVFTTRGRPLRASSAVACLLLIAITLGAAGCKDDPAAPLVGSLTIDAEPDDLDAPWQVSGPAGFARAGNGDDVLGDLAAGDYTLTWGAVTGWTSPEPTTESLPAGGALTFTGTYVPQGLPFPGSADQLMQNFQTLYEEMDYQKFLEMIHPDYTMILSASTRGEFPDVGTTLDMNEEQRIHERMFSQHDVTDPNGALVPGVQAIQFQTFIRQGSWTTSPPNDPIPNAEYALYDAVILLDRGQNYSTLKVQGAIKFYVTHRDSLVGGVTRSYYQMVGQLDLTQAPATFHGKAVATESWGSVKCLFR
jgi:hypothetical protein